MLPIDEEILTEGFQTLTNPMDTTASPDGWNSDGMVPAWDTKRSQRQSSGMIVALLYVLGLTNEDPNEATLPFILNATFATALAKAISSCTMSDTRQNRQGQRSRRKNETYMLLLDERMLGGLPNKARLDRHSSR